jgi:hypothetical protein
MTLTIIYDNRLIRKSVFKNKERAISELSNIASAWRIKKECRVLEDKETVFSFNIGYKDFVCSIQ